MRCDFAAATNVAVKLYLILQAPVAQLPRGWSQKRSDPRLMGLGIRSGSSVVAAGVGLGYAPCIPGPLRCMRYASYLRSSPRVFLRNSTLLNEKIHDMKNHCCSLSFVHEIRREPTPFMGWPKETVREISNLLDSKTNTKRAITKMAVSHRH